MTTSGGTPSRKRKDYYNGTIPWVKSGELNDGYIVETAEHITVNGLKNSSAKLFPAKTLLIALYGATVGKTSILRIKASTNQAVCGITPGSELVTEYLHYYLIFQRPKLLSHRYGGAQPNISQQIIRNLEIDYPPLPEQKKIAHILSTVQRAIEEQGRIIQTTTELKKALMQKLFTEGLRGEPQKETEIGLVPESWEESTLGEIACFSSGGTPSRKKKEYWKGGNIPWVKTGEVNYKTIFKTEETITEVGLKGSSAKLFPKNTLLIAMYGQGITRGRVGILGIDAATNQACAAITPKDENRVETEYLYFYLEYLYEELRNRGHGANQKNLSATLLKMFPVTFPDTDSQQKIIGVLLSCDRKITLARNRTSNYKDLFRTLLHELMIAKIRVDEIELSDFKFN